MNIQSPNYPHRGGCDGQIEEETIEFPDTEVIPASPTEQPIRVDPTPVETPEEPIHVPNWPAPVEVPHEN